MTASNDRNQLDIHSVAPAAGAEDPSATLAAVSQLAAMSFATVDEAIDATLRLMQRLLQMEVRMVNQIDGDQLLFRKLQLPGDMPPLEGLVTPLNHNF
jgi:hypothetical protein